VNPIERREKVLDLYRRLKSHWMWWDILALRRLRQEDHKLKASLVHMTRPCLKKDNNKKTSWADKVA
jgi:hypothetical protein